jgi:hypothetical protein
MFAVFILGSRARVYARRSTVEGRIAAKLEPDTPATFGDSAGVALKDDKDGAEVPWESNLPAMNKQPIVDEVMSDAMEEHSQQTASEQPKVHSLILSHNLSEVPFNTCQWA